MMDHRYASGPMLMEVGIGPFFFFIQEMRYEL